jgi:hypothetical protein
MAKKLLIALVAIMGVSILAMAATKPNFSGTWALDRARSFGMPGDMTQVLTITQTDDKMEIEPSKTRSSSTARSTSSHHRRRQTLPRPSQRQKANEPLRGWRAISRSQLRT